MHLKSTREAFRDGHTIKRYRGYAVRRRPTAPDHRLPRDCGRYRYFNVPPEEWEAFRTAKSKGTYLNEVFKSRGYIYEKISTRRAT